MVKIAIDAGHGMNTAGKRTPDGEREWHFNDTVARWVVHNLKGYEGVETKRLDDTSGKTDVPLKARTDAANAWGADSLVSIHHNGLLGEWGAHTGTETYIYPDSIKGLELAKAVHPELVKRFKLKDRGIKEENFHMLRESIMPAILTEGGYMDSRIDIVAMRDENRLRAQADGITAGLVKFHKLKKKVAPAPVKSQPEVTKPVANEKKKDDVHSSIRKEFEAAIKDKITTGERPNENATRAEAAVMVYRSQENLKAYIAQEIKKLEIR